MCITDRYFIYNNNKCMSVSVALSGPVSKTGAPCRIANQIYVVYQTTRGFFSSCPLCFFIGPVCLRILEACYMCRLARIFFLADNSFRFKKKKPKF